MTARPTLFRRGGLRPGAPGSGSRSPAPPFSPAPAEPPRRGRLEGGTNGGGAATPGTALRPFSVGEVSARVQRAVEDRFPNQVWVEGELSAVGGRDHLFLTFREGDATLEGVVWSSDAARLGFRPEVGDRVRAGGRLRAWPRRSNYQLYIRTLRRAGRGALLEELEERKERLRREGVFDPKRKRPLPYLPLRIGLLTSATSDAYHDFVRTAHRRFPGLRIVHADTAVQGVRAMPELCAGLRRLGERDLDLVVVTRGGGSFEDLLPFSDEALVRAAAACPVPVVSAVGHEQDRPLLDEAADYRAKTPTAAAEEVIRAAEDLEQETDGRRGAARSVARSCFSTLQSRIRGLATHRGMSAAPRWLAGRLDAARHRRHQAAAAFGRAVESRRSRLEGLRGRIAERHPSRPLTERQQALDGLRRRLAGIRSFAEPERRSRTAGAQLSPEPLRRRLAAAREEVRGCRRQASAAARISRDALGSRQLAALGQLRALDPKAVLRRGYSVTLDAAGRAVRNATEVRVGDPVRITLAAGELGARIETRRPPGTAEEAR